MSWSYSQGLVEEFSAQCFSDTGLSALLSTTYTPDQYYWPDKTTEHSRISRFGMTCEPLTAIRGEELLTWYLAASRVKTSALPETGPDWTAKGQGYGEKWLGLLGKYDPASCSLKTAQLSLLEDSTECCVTLPRWGLMLDGELYPQPMLEPSTAENESGFWPTPTCASVTKEVVSSQKFNNLVAFTKMFPTPTATDGKGAPTLEKVRARALESKRGVRLPEQIARGGEVGQLNPNWVEWLMGWPIGLTDLKPLETAKFQEFEQQHGSYFMDDKKCA